MGDISNCRWFKSGLGHHSRIGEMGNIYKNITKLVERMSESYSSAGSMPSWTSCPS
jgi:hypothetical protein